MVRFGCLSVLGRDARTGDWGYDYALPIVYILHTNVSIAWCRGFRGLLGAKGSFTRVCPTSEASALLFWIGSELDDHWFEDRHVAFLLQSFGRLEVSYTFI